MSTVQIIGTCPLNIKATPPYPKNGPYVSRWMANDPTAYTRIGFREPDSWTAWFNVHRTNHIQQRHPNFFPWAKQQDGRPIYLLENPPMKIPGLRLFPGQDIVTTLHDDFFTHQAAWLVAFAMVQGFTRIELWGFQFGAGSKSSLAKVKHKYAWERPCIIHWLARAKQAGIELVLPREARLHKKEFLYGYEGPPL